MNTSGTEMGGSPSGGTNPSGGVAAGGSSGAVSGGSDSGSAGSAGSSECQSPIPGPGRYLIRDRVGDRCLQKGEPDATLFAVFTALLDGDCSVPEAEWDLLEVPPNYALHNVGIDANLDVRTGAWTDGTPLVLYMPRAGSNQLFAIRSHTPPYFALEPQNALGKCVEAVGAGAELFPCDDTNQAQDFDLIRADCP
jgi:hypothetical protein